MAHGHFWRVGRSLFVLPHFLTYLAHHQLLQFLLVIVIWCRQKKSNQFSQAEILERKLEISRSIVISRIQRTAGARTTATTAVWKTGEDAAPGTEVTDTACLLPCLDSPWGYCYQPLDTAAAISNFLELSSSVPVVGGKHQEGLGHLLVATCWQWGEESFVPLRLPQWEAFPAS